MNQGKRNQPNAQHLLEQDRRPQNQRQTVQVMRNQQKSDPQAEDFWRVINGTKTYAQWAKRWNVK